MSSIGAFPAGFNRGCVCLRGMRLHLSLVLDVDDGALGVGALLAPCHGDIRTLQMVERDGVGRLVAEVAADLVEGKLGRVLELVIPQPERRIQHARQDGDELGLLLGGDVGAERLAEQVAQVGQRVVQVGLRAQRVGAGLSYPAFGLAGVSSASAVVHPLRRRT